MLNLGDRFGDYTVVKQLGQGGMGAVFLLENAEGGQVAAKILDPATAGDHESRKRFLREAELALGVKHPNLVETYDVGEDPETGFCYILMEYAPNGSLADRIKAGPLAVNDAIRIVYQIASVLELARQRGIVHRDIKPGNILFGADGKPKLADLGIARGGIGGTETTTVTQTGMMIGTPAYMAPEQMLDAHHVDIRADIYSLGIVFYEMLVGRRPNADDTVVQLMAKAVAGEPIPDVRTLRPEVSASVAELISLMCAMKAEERISTPVEVTTAISQIVHGHEVTIVRKRPSVVSKKSASRSGSVRKVVAILFGCVAVAGIAMLVYFGSRGRPSAIPSSMVTKTNVVEKVVERVIEKKVESKATVFGTAAPHPESGKSKDWRPGPNGRWFVNWDEALADARDRQRPILVLNTGSTWCHWCKKLRMEVLDHDVFKAFADERLTLLYLDSPCENVDQRNHNKLIVKELKFSGGVPNVRVFTAAGKLLGSIGGGGLAAEAYVAKLRDILSKGGEDKLDADGRMLFTDGYAALAAKIAEERAKLPKVSKSDFKAKLVGVAVVDGDNRSRWNLNAEFLPPETHVEVPFGKTALFKVEYDFPEGYEARVWTRDEWTGEQRRNSSFFGSNPSGLYKGKGVTTGFLSLLARGKGCDLKSLAIRTSSEPEIDDKTREWKIGSFPVDVVFKEKDAEAMEGSSVRESAAPPSGRVDPGSLKDPDLTRATQKALDAFFPGWRVQDVKSAQADDAEWQSGFVPMWRGLRNVVATHPPSGERPTVLSKMVRITHRHPVLLIETASQSKDADFMLSVKVDGRVTFGPHVVCTPDEHPYESVVVPLEKWRGKQVKIEVEHACNGWFYEHAFWSKLEIAEGGGKEVAGPVGVVRTEVFPRANPSSSRWKKRAPWLYVTEAPAVGWKDHGFDDRKWKRTVKALGDDRPPEHMSVAQLWKSDRIWIRRKFSWNGPTDIYKVELDLYYDQDVEIFLNGREIARRGGWNTDWVPQCVDSHAFAGALRRGENVLAVTLKGNSGGSYFDCGLSIETLGGNAEAAIPGRASVDPKKLYHDDTTKAVQKVLNALFPGWKTSANRTRNKGTSSVVGYVADYRGKRDLVCTLPPSEDEPVSISRRMRLPSGHPALRLSVCKNMTYQADFLLQVLVDGRKVHEEHVNDGKWHEPVVDLSEWAGRDVKVEVRQCQLKDNAWGRAYWSKIFVE